MSESCLNRPPVVGDGWSVTDKKTQIQSAGCRLITAEVSDFPVLQELTLSFVSVHCYYSFISVRINGDHIQASIMAFFM